MQEHDKRYKMAPAVPHASSGKSDQGAYMYDMIQKVIANGATDFVFKLTPATKNQTVTGSVGTRKVKIQVCDALGNVHTWFNKTITTAITESSTDGTVTNVTSCKIVNGEGVINCAKAGTWLAGETNTVTASAQTILGMSVLAVTSVETIVADP